MADLYIDIDDFPSYKPPFILGIFHGYVSHNQMLCRYKIHMAQSENRLPPNPLVNDHLIIYHLVMTNSLPWKDPPTFNR